MMTTKILLMITLCLLKVTNITASPNEGLKSVKIEKVAESVELGEGPHWDVKSQKLYYVNLLGGHQIIRYDPVTGNRTFATMDGKYVGMVVPVEGTTNKFVAGVDRNVVIVTWNGKQNIQNPPVKKLASVDTDRNDTRVNDGKCDTEGRFWVGTMAFHVNGYVKPNRGSLYRIDKNGTVNKILSPISIGNGLTWSLKNDVMYYIDSQTHQIWAFDYNSRDGTITNKRVIYELKNDKLGGVPDGMTNDADGNLWVALFDGQAVIQVDPKKKKLIRKIDLPVKKVSCPTFGGPNLDELYVTTARFGMTAEEIKQKPDSGALYRITGLGVKGLPAHNCKYNI